MRAKRRRDRRAPVDEPFDVWLRRELPADLCELADQIGERAVQDVLAPAAEIEFDTYACATFVPAEVAAIGGRVEGVFRRGVRHAMATRLLAAWPDRTYEGEEPDVLVEAHPEATPAGRLEVHAAFVAGRYRKLERGLSQTVFHCRPCRGRGRRGGVDGCERCGGSGRLAAEAVSDFVTPSIERALGGSVATFHGAGREDVDVLMLGDGRPFVVSVQRPSRRTFDPEAVAREIEAASGGRVAVADLRRVGRAERRRLTTEHGEKLYRARVRPISGELPSDAAARLASLSGAVLEQRTPRRVNERRADLVRRRRVLELAVEEASESELVLRLRTEPGTYVKELISSDEGRTRPSVSELLGVPCVCAELDVLGVNSTSPAG